MSGVVDARDRPRLVFMANTMYSSIVSGGEIHTLNLTARAVEAGFRVHFFTGHALKAELDRRHLPATVTLTDEGIMPARDFTTLAGQFRLLANFHGRYRGALRRLDGIGPEDIVYAATDFWWDSVPVARCCARRKIMYVGMDCPSLREIVFKSRPDVRTSRIASVHYWLTQHLTIQLFRRCPNKRVLYAHENQRARLRGFGFGENELMPVLNGVDLKAPAAVPEQQKVYDVAWVGRAHKQKGIEDLVDTLAFLAANLETFRAILVGDLRPALGPQIAARGLERHVEFSGYMPEAEKFRLLKSSRVFLMPSRYESWGIVIGEALASRVPVVAYELAAYRPVFGELLRYVPAFDAGAFREAALDEVRRARAGEKRLNEDVLTRFIRENSWEAVGDRFLSAVRSFDEGPAAPR